MAAMAGVCQKAHEQHMVMLAAINWQQERSAAAWREKCSLRHLGSQLAYEPAIACAHAGRW